MLTPTPAPTRRPSLSPSVGSNPTDPVEPPNKPRLRGFRDRRGTLCGGGHVVCNGCGAGYPPGTPQRACQSCGILYCSCCYGTTARQCAFCDEEDAMDHERPIRDENTGEPGRWGMGLDRGCAL